MSGRHAAVRAVHADLLVEVAARAHPGQLGHPAQLHLAPAAAGLGPPQGRDQRLGLQPQLLGVWRAMLTCSASAACDGPGPRPTRAAGPPPGPACPSAARPGARPRPCGSPARRRPWRWPRPAGPRRSPGTAGCSASSASADRAWNRSASWPSTSAARSWAARAAVAWAAAGLPGSGWPSSAASASRRGQQVADRAPSTTAQDQPGKQRVASIFPCWQPGVDSSPPDTRARAAVRGRGAPRLAG